MVGRLRRSAKAPAPPAGASGARARRRTPTLPEYYDPIRRAAPEIGRLRIRESIAGFGSPLTGDWRPVGWPRIRLLKGYIAAPCRSSRSICKRLKTRRAFLPGCSPDNGAAGKHRRIASPWRGI